jgi:hypothetical protein
LGIHPNAAKAMFPFVLVEFSPEVGLGTCSFSGSKLLVTIYHPSNWNHFCFAHTFTLPKNAEKQSGILS